MNPQLQMMLQQAIQAFQGGNFDRADSILKKVIQADSKNLPALHVLGLIKASQQKYQEASELLKKAARLDSRCVLLVATWLVPTISEENNG